MQPQFNNRDLKQKHDMVRIARLPSIVYLQPPHRLAQLPVSWVSNTIKTFWDIGHVLLYVLIKTAILWTETEIKLLFSPKK